MSDKQLSLEQRVDALEAKITIIGTGLSAILTELAGVGEAEQAEAQAPVDLNRITWVEAEGPKGKFEKSEDINNPEFKKLVKTLAEHDGKMTISDDFVWLYRNGSTVGRKERNY